LFPPDCFIPGSLDRQSDILELGFWKWQYIFASNITPGTYTIRLTATNATGSNTLTQTAFITVYENPVVNFTADNTSGCFPFRVQFTDLSTAGLGNTSTSWQWDFGNGATSSLQNPSVTYSIAGTYTVTLTVTNDKGCRRTIVRPNYINVTTGVIAGFTNTTSTVCRPPANISFTNTSTGPGVLSYQWDFGDGNTSTATNPVNIYNAAGSYIVTLITTSSAGCVDTFRSPVPIVIGGIITAFTAPASACTNETITLTNTSSPVPVSTLWNFGDGNTATTLNATHVYAVAGVYTIRLYNTYSNCQDSAQQTITINPQPVADFSSPDTIRCEPSLTSNFTDLTTGGVIGWQWDFGDGGTSTLQNPSHTYTAYGLYTVTLIATNGFGCKDTIVKTNYVRIQRAQISIPSLPVRGCVPYTITPVANVIALDVITSWFWDFGDGFTSSLQFPSHTYPLQGTYTVKLFITTSTGCTDSLVIPNAVRVGTKPVADFSLAPNPVCARQPVQFTDLSIPADEWIWDFGEGGSSSVQNPVHNYQDTGYFNVTLIATNNGCPDTAIKTNIIQVLPPIARFTPVPNCLNRLEFTFTDQSVVPLTWSWDFGDATTSTAQNPVHVFPALGSYNVRLIVTNGGCADTMIQTIRTVNETPQFTADNTTLCKNAFITFQVSNITLPNIVSYWWNFGDGNTQSTPVSVIGHTYITSGTYTVTLATTDINGCTDTVRRTNYIRINGPVANFTATNTSGCTGLTTTFNNLSTSDGVNAITGWQFNFGDGNIQNFSAPPFQHVYNTAGNYSVQLIVTDAAGCRDSITLPNIINATDPVPNFNTADTLTCPGATANFSNTSTGNTLLYNWSFGDGNTSAAPAPSHIYTATGLYTVKLTITDLYGCVDSLIRNLYVRVDTPMAAFNVSDSIGACLPLQINFTNTSQYYTSSFWDFGTGNNSTLNNPVHFFSLPGIYNVKLVVTSPGGCKDSTFKAITIYDTTASQLSYLPYQSCAPVNAVLNVITNGNYTYLWDFGDGGTLTTTVPTASHTYLSYGVFKPKVVMQDPAGCLIPVEGIDSIQVWGAVADFGIDNNLFCDRGTVNFTDSTLSSDSIVNYSWAFGDGGTSTQINPAHNYLSPGLYNIRLIVTTQTGCLDTIQKNNFISVVQRPLIDIVGDTAICVNQSLLHAGIFLQPDTSVVRWQWSFPNGNSSASQNPSTQTYTNSGTFPVTAIATNSSNCKDTVVQNIVVFPLPTATLPVQMTVQNGFPVTIPATYSPNTISWSWTPTAGLSCTNCPTPDAGPKMTTTYNVLFTDNNGCVNTGTVEVIVICKDGQLFIPNTFSPNGDGVNDRFYPRGRGLERVKTLRIFNRWGEVVYEKYNVPVNNAAAGWDGTYKGKKPIADVYIYQAEVFCENSQVIRLNGNIALIL
jgi:gliding motility-associated-like protein